MNYEWTFLNRGVHDTWRKAKSFDSARRAAMKIARRQHPKDCKGYLRYLTHSDGSTLIDFGHYTVFIEIRKLK